MTIMPPDVIRDRIVRGFRVIGRGRAWRGPYQPRFSSAGKCVRALSYHRQGYAESDPMPVKVGLVFEVGDVLHAWMDRQLRKLGLPVERREHRLEIRSPWGLVITGHFDRSIGGTTIVDYKTSSDAAFRLAVRQNAPLFEHRAQINGYIGACQEREELQAYRHGLIVMFNMETREEPWVSPPITHDPTLAAATIAKFDEVERHAQAGTLPERPYTSPGEYPCKFCSWRRLCWGETISAEHTEPAADLSALAGRARAYVELGEQVRTLERERDRAEGALRAALADAEVRRGVAGPYEVKLITYTRPSVKADLLPPDIRVQATVETPVTRLLVANRDADAVALPATEPTATSQTTDPRP